MFVWLPRKFSFCYDLIVSLASQQCFSLVKLSTLGNYVFGDSLKIRSQYLPTRHYSLLFFIVNYLYKTFTFSTNHICFFQTYIRWNKLKIKNIELTLKLCVRLSNKTNESSTVLPCRRLGVLYIKIKYPTKMNKDENKLNHWKFV